MSQTGPSLRYQAHLRTPSPDPDAGLRGLGHYERKLPRWRYMLRQWLIPLIRWETPYLARLQQACRTPFLDSYFAITANLGTHTFFMTFLPICFWCGYPDFGIALVHMLAAGVYLSGYAKDLVCLPRPLSPPLHRITMSGSAALEYGFPSTHTTNAVSVAFYCLHELWKHQDGYSAVTFRILVGLCLCYATSIGVGRMYCGMHGFFDVIFGAFLGAIIASIRVAFGPAYDNAIISGNFLHLCSAVAVMALAVRFHPEPADNCPCFDDSVAFIGVVMGSSIASWDYSRRLTGAAHPDISLSQMFAYTNEDLAKSLGRLIGGIIAIFVWRAVAKPFLLTTLPPIFRFVGHYGVRIPRRFFLQSRDYKSVPALQSDDKVLPPASAIPEMISSIRRRKRTISVGPQSEADAREHIANREQMRREARSANASRSRSPKRDLRPLISDQTVLFTPDEPQNASSYLSVHSDMKAGVHTPTQAKTAIILTPPLSDGGGSSDEGKEDEKADQKLFSVIEKPRVRYDVEVITKLIVYAGIAGLSLEGNPILFAYLGLS